MPLADTDGAAGDDAIGVAFNGDGDGDGEGVLGGTGDGATGLGAPRYCGRYCFNWISAKKHSILPGDAYGARLEAAPIHGHLRCGAFATCHETVSYIRTCFGGANLLGNGLQTAALI